MRRDSSKVLWGLLLIVIGALILLDNLGVIFFDVSDFIVTWWPLILIIIGVNIILNNRSRRRSTGKSGD